MKTFFRHFSVRRLLPTIFYFLSTIYCLLLTGCAQSPLCVRIGSDYFPIEEGLEWTYLKTTSSDTDTVYIKVIDTTNVYDRECWLIERDGIPEYWWKSDRRVDKFFSQTIFVNGEEDTLLKCWVPWLQLPFVVHNSWKYSFNNRKIILNDTVEISLEIEGKVVNLDRDVYKVENLLVRKQTSNLFGSYLDSLIYREWYSPEIGVKKRIFSDTTEVLLDSQ